MEFAPHPNPRLIYLAVLIVLLVSVAVIRLRKGRSETPTDEVTRNRLKKVYLCFLLMNVLGGFAAGVMLIPVSAESQQGLAMGAGMLLAVTVWIALPVAAYNSLFLWRRRPVQVLWLLVLILFSTFAMFLDVMQDVTALLLVLAYSLSTITLAVRGLTTLRQRPSDPAQLL